MKSRIEWTEYTWNPVTGCTKISPGCLNCYAERFAKRLKAMKNARYKSGFNVSLHHDLLTSPMKWKLPKYIFVNSMSDLFHEKVPNSFIYETFEVMNNCRQHIFQILTKRSHRLEKIAKELNWTNNIWIGVSIENAQMAFRIKSLLKTTANIKFISCEPLIGPISSLPLDGIDWVIVGGESGPNARPMKKEWAVSIRDNCIKKGIPYFFKQWGGVNKKTNGRLLDGKEWSEMPPLAQNNL